MASRTDSPDLGRQNDGGAVADAGPRDRRSATGVSRGNATLATLVAAVAFVALPGHLGAQGDASGERGPSKAPAVVEQSA